MTTWRKKITAELSNHPDDLIVISITPDESVLDIEFDSGYGGVCGPAFTAWTRTRVLFPACYDGAEWVASVPRNPCGETTEHIGGG